MILYVNWRDISELVAGRKELQNRNDILVKQVKQALRIQKEQQSHLAHQAKLASMGEMISMIAHQWRQPLATISSIISGIQVKQALEVLEDDFLYDRLADMNSVTQRMSQTINDFKEFFVPHQKKERFKLEDIVDAACRIAEPLLIKEKITINRNFSKVSSTESFKSEIVQVILNLLTNSKDVLVEKKVKNSIINIKLSENATEQIIEISDNGGGIDASVAEKIFDPYYSTKRERNGSGLGLYMSKRIIEDHCNGKLIFHNIDNGAMFKILLKRE
jgi:two-component system, NtrC family, C4-dicarboxylate transport sensor histidine kinase DctB